MSVAVFVRLGGVTLDSCPEPVTSCCGWQIMTIEEGRDVAAILRILRDSFSNSAVDNGMIDSLILMDKPIAQPVLLARLRAKGTDTTPACAAMYLNLVPQSRQL
jgi:hypothetical protein